MANLFGDNWLLSLDFVIKLDISLDSRLDWLGAHLLAQSFELSDNFLEVFGSHETEDELASDEHDTLTLLLKLGSELRKEREVKGWRVMLRFDKVELGSLVGVNDVLYLEVQDLLILLLGDVGELLVLIEESMSGGLDLALVNTPGAAKIIHDFLLFVHFSDSFFMSDIV